MTTAYLSAARSNTSLELLEIQLEGKKRTTARDFIQGYRPQTGEKLGVEVLRVPLCPLW